MPVLLSAVQMKCSVINFTNDRLDWEAAGTTEAACCSNKCTDELTRHQKYPYQPTWTSAYCSSPC